MKKPFLSKLLLLAALAGAAGCQTTSTNGPASVAVGAHEKSEKLLLRIDKIVDTYSVNVQRVELQGANPKQTDHWSVAASAEVSGYPGTFRKSDGTIPMAAAVRKGTFLLDGTPVECALDPGVQLVLKVVPELQNTARIVGIFSQTRMTPNGVETFSLPFDVRCDLGKVVVLYQKDLPVSAD